MKDLDDVPGEAVQELHFVPVERIDDVIAIALHANAMSLSVDESILVKPMERHKQGKM